MISMLIGLMPPDILMSVNTKVFTTIIKFLRKRSDSDEKNFYLLPMKFLFRGISYIAVAYRFNI